MRLRCISLHQPWASLILAGVKRHETRGFMPPEAAIGEPIGIHAARRPVHPTELSPGLKRICFETFGGGGWEHRLPRGALICRGVLGWAGPVAQRGSHPPGLYEAVNDVLCGDFSEGRYAWRIDEVTPLVPMFACKGGQLWFYVDVPRKTGRP